MTKVTVLVTALLCLSRAASAFIPRPDSRLTSLCTRLMSARDDFYHEPHFQVLERESVAKEPLSYNRMLECAQQGECSVEEMERMIAELKDNTGMKALKQALLLQRELASLKDELQESVKPDEPKYSVGTYDHSFQHYVDYKDIGAYESH